MAIAAIVISLWSCALGNGALAGDAFAFDTAPRTAPATNEDRSPKPKRARNSKSIDQEKGKLPVEQLVSSTIGLADINRAMDELADGHAVRQVIVFD